jgi:selenocysteine-specific elongation factor
VIGHVDHGKTALVRALTGMETDRLPDEQRRGISIALGFAHLSTDGHDIDLIDMPGHERFVRTMVSGATGVGAVVVVVAANEGIKPQTIEHIDIAALLGVRRAAPVITKADLVSPDAAIARGEEVERLLTAYGFESERPVITSATTGAGLEALRGTLARLAQATPPPDDGFPYLPIDRVFSITGHGTVATGTLRRGPSAASPAGRRSRPTLAFGSCSARQMLRCACACWIARRSSRAPALWPNSMPLRP